MLNQDFNSNVYPHHLAESHLVNDQSFQLVEDLPKHEFLSTDCTIFKSLYHLNLCDAHEIFVKNLMNLLNSFHLNIIKLDAKFDKNNT